MPKVRTIRFLLIAALIAACGAFAQAQDDRAAAQISAARDNAIADLRSDIGFMRLAQGMTVSQFLQKSDAVATFDKTLQMAQQIGGPRWVDDKTCQVRLEIEGWRVASALSTIAGERAGKSPIPPVQLQQSLQDWKQRTFSATGTSVAGDRALSIRPGDAGQKWLSVRDDARQQAVDAARQDATQRLMDAIRPIQVAPGQTIGDLLTKEQVQSAVRDWVASRPVTQLRFREDLQVEVTASTPGDELLQTILESARKAPGTTLPSDDASMEKLRMEFAGRVTDSTGRAGVRNESADRALVEIPSVPPGWVAQPLDAEGIAQRGASPLRTKSEAESTATENLRARVVALPLSRGVTIDDAVHKDPRIADAVNRALLRTRVETADYRPDGSFKVRVTLNPRELWDEIRRATGQ